MLTILKPRAPQRHQRGCVEVEEIIIERRVNRTGAAQKQKAPGLSRSLFFCVVAAVRTAWRPGPWPA